MVVQASRRPELAILITGAGAPGTRGTAYALRQNPDGRSVRLIGTDAAEDNAGRYLVDAFYRVPEPESTSYLERISDICRVEGVRIIIPQTTREIAVLSREISSLSKLGVRTMVSEAHAIEKANDKCRLLQEFERIGLPVPAYRVARNERDLTEAVSAFGYPQTPVVVKPPVSNGMRGIRILRENAWDLRRFLGEKPSGLETTLADLLGILRRGDPWPELLVTEYLPGAEYTVDVFVGEKAHAAVPRERIAIRSGITFTSRLEWRDDLSTYSIRAALHLRLRYAVGFQYKLDVAGTPRVLECNPRVQGTMVASVFSGINVIWLSVREIEGDVPTTVPAHVEGGSFYRFWGGVSVCGERVDEI